MTDNREYMTHQEELGSIQISDEVIASIAANAAMEVDGFSGMMAGNVADFMGGKNKKLVAKGVRVEKAEEGATAVTLYLMLRYGCNVGEVAKKVQNAVYTALEGMTGFQISAVNIHVDGISFN